ncbi:hypothetical protein CBR_g30407 [Chara braunii]|uniref:Uncharacterized protein n=1 Tax=Chara braunii TaxID=69332 RepID=A0A388LCM0_CHABU|nr:hypothetical protein CBR_g30407 [Chara braunii]|eukprot:GBG80038.1 hypothetical protein CBR_g30407 [Chara braunii]
MSDVIDRLMHWSLPAIRSEFGHDVTSRIAATLPPGSRAEVFRLGGGGDDSTADADDYGEPEGVGSRGGNGGSFCGSDDPLPRWGHASQHGRRSRGRPPACGRSRSQFDYVRLNGALQSEPYHDRSDVLKTTRRWKGLKAPDIVFVKPVKLLQLLGLFDLCCPRHGGGCRVDVSCVGYPGQICRIPFAYRKTCRWTWHNALITGTVHSCRLHEHLFYASVTAGMTYTVLNNFCIVLGVTPVHKPTFYSNIRVHEKELLDALSDRFGPGCLTLKEERLKKSDFVAVGLSKMYPYGTTTNEQSLLVDPDGVTEFHVHKVGHWFLGAAELCRDEGGDSVTLHNDTMMIVEHWAGDHLRCVGNRELLCARGGDPCRLPLYTRNEPVHDIIRQTLGRYCSTTACSYYTEFRHTSTVETFQGTIIIYAKKALHFEKSYEPRLAIAIIRWNTHAWQDPVEYRARMPSGTSIRPRPSYYRHNHPPQDSWVDRLSTFIFGWHGVSDWAQRLLEYDDCDVVGEVGSSTPPLPRNFFCRGEETIGRDENDVDSGADLDVVGGNNVFIIGVGDQLPGPANAVSDRSCYSLSYADDVELVDD